jgi:hypothetical protein
MDSIRRLCEPIIATMVAAALCVALSSVAAYSLNRYLVPIEFRSTELRQHAFHSAAELLVVVTGQPSEVRVQNDQYENRQRD